MVDSGGLRVGIGRVDIAAVEDTHPTVPKNSFENCEWHHTRAIRLRG
jgi:hypothetical protein